MTLDVPLVRLGSGRGGGGEDDGEPEPDGSGDAITGRLRINVLFKPKVKGREEASLDE